jgi:hypothetical protein
VFDGVSDSGCFDCNNTNCGECGDITDWDDCQDCYGDNNDKDCGGVCGGSAYEDDCGNCVCGPFNDPVGEGSTCLLPIELGGYDDGYASWADGDSYTINGYDQTWPTTAGSYIIPCQADCNGDPGGSGQLDDCDKCYTIEETPNLQNDEQAWYSEVNATRCNFLHGPNLGCDCLCYDEPPYPAVDFKCANASVPGGWNNEDGSGAPGLCSSSTSKADPYSYNCCVSDSTHVNFGKNCRCTLEPCTQDCAGYWCLDSCAITDTCGDCFAPEHATACIEGYPAGEADCVFTENELTSSTNK